MDPSPTRILSLRRSIFYCVNTSGHQTRSGDILSFLAHGGKLGDLVRFGSPPPTKGIERTKQTVSSVNLGLCVQERATGLMPVAHGPTISGNDTARSGWPSRGRLLADLHDRRENVIVLGDAAASRSGRHAKASGGAPIIFYHLGQSLGAGL